MQSLLHWHENMNGSRFQTGLLKWDCVTAVRFDMMVPHLWVHYHLYLLESWFQWRLTYKARSKSISNQFLVWLWCWEWWYTDFPVLVVGNRWTYCKLTIGYKCRHSNIASINQIYMLTHYLTCDRWRGIIPPWIVELLIYIYRGGCTASYGGLTAALNLASASNCWRLILWVLNDSPGRWVWAHFTMIRWLP